MISETLVWTQGSEGNTREEVRASFARRSAGRHARVFLLPGGRFQITGRADYYRLRLEPGGVYAIYRED